MDASRLATVMVEPSTVASRDDDVICDVKRHNDSPPRSMQQMSCERQTQIPAARDEADFDVK
jgi:hypothetical protein